MALPKTESGWPNDLTEPVHFLNHQWAVTAYGVECVAGSRYHFEGKRVDEIRSGTDLYDWPLHMAEKEWVDLDAFVEALQHALQIHRPSTFDQARFDRSATEALHLRRRYSPP